MRRHLLLLLTLVCAPVLGQQRGTIAGHVQAPDGSPAGRVGITAVQTGSGVRVGVQTDEQGNFRIENAPAGSYQIFASALAAPVTVTGKTMQVVVVSRSLPMANRGEGTYFPGTPSPQTAGTVTVYFGQTTANVDITLAPKSTPFIDVPLQTVRGRFVAEGGGTPTIGSSELAFMISDSPANVHSEVAFRGGYQSRDSIRFQSLSGPKAFSSVLAMPADARFQLILPDGVYRVSPQGPTKDNGHDPRYYVKSMSFGKIDLTRELMTISGAPQDEMVITLAKCMDSKDPACN